MFEIVLYQPEIPPNTGNIIRLAANTGCRLHLVQPLGFSLRDKQLQRAGLDYQALAEVMRHDDWRACRDFLPDRRVFAVTTRGKVSYDRPAYRQGDVLLFGSETHGLPGSVIDTVPAEQRIRVPMLAESRSLNLANAVSVVVYEGWRQLGFRGGK